MILNGIDERICLLNIRSGKTEAFLKIYDRYVAEINRFVSFKVDGSELAEDIVSDVFVRALEYAADEDRPMVKSVRPFLYQIARAAVADHYRERKPTAELEQAEGLASSDASSTYEGSHQLQQALRSLPEDQREAVLLKHMEGLSAGEVGQIMGRSAGAVRVLVHRGLEKLREEMGEV